MTVERTKSRQIHEAGSGVSHVCLKVKDIKGAFEHLQQQEDIEFVSNQPDYGPHQLDPADPASVQFFPPRDDAQQQQHEIAELMGRVSSLYFRDPYGLLWVFDQIG